MLRVDGWWLRAPLLVCGVLAACGGRSVQAGSAGATGGAGGTSTVTCPTVDYCALRCSPDLPELPLYPPTCNVPTCSCLVGVQERDDWSGTYSMPDDTDAVNLVLEQDGTFRWSRENCGSFVGDCGTWGKTGPGTIELLPAAGSATFGWPDGDAVSQLLATAPSPTSQNILVEVPSPGEKPNGQLWQPGGMCFNCAPAAEALYGCSNAMVRCR